MKIKLSQIAKNSLLVATFFLVDKVIGLIRQVVIVRQFGLSHELDAFNVANNLPDMLFALISGGALAMAFIPVLTQILTLEGRESAWRLFSRIANLAFVVTATAAIIIAIISNQLVEWQVGIAPGFERPQQLLVAELMRVNLIATVIFSLSGLVIAGLQANQHFLLPAAAPVLYNIGQIFGALILAPQEGYSIGGYQLPAFGMGVHGLVYGVIIGALLHLLIQIPGLLKYRFHWEFGIHLKDQNVQQCCVFWDLGLLPCCLFN
jgi:putative peptidoglycan lipid II flippase